MVYIYTASAALPPEPTWSLLQACFSSTTDLREPTDLEPGSPAGAWRLDGRFPEKTAARSTPHAYNRCGDFSEKMRES
jgi:hypothetical protein